MHLAREGKGMHIATYRNDYLPAAYSKNENSLVSSSLLNKLSFYIYRFSDNLVLAAGSIEPKEYSASATYTSPLANSLQSSSGDLALSCTGVVVVACRHIAIFLVFFYYLHGTDEHL